MTLIYILFSLFVNFYKISKNNISIKMRTFDWNSIFTWECCFCFIFRFQPLPFIITLNFWKPVLWTVTQIKANAGGAIWSSSGREWFRTLIRWRSAKWTFIVSGAGSTMKVFMCVRQKCRGRDSPLKGP